MKCLCKLWVFINYRMSSWILKCFHKLENPSYITLHIIKCTHKLIMKCHHKIAMKCRYKMNYDAPSRFSKKILYIAEQWYSQIWYFHRMKIMSRSYVIAKLLTRQLGFSVNSNLKFVYFQRQFDFYEWSCLMFSTDEHYSFYRKDFFLRKWSAFY